MKPTPRLIRRRFAQAYGALFSFNGVPMVISGGLVLALAVSFILTRGREQSVFVSILAGVSALAYCVPWGAVTDPVSPEEEPFV